MTVDERSPLITASHDHTTSESNSRSRDTSPNLKSHRHARRTRPVTPIPKFQIAVLLFLSLAEPVTNTVIYPFVNQLIEETGITKGDYGKVGYYAGLIESLFFVAEALMVLHWGRLSDKIGRKPVLTIGVMGLATSMLSFGLSKTFWALVVSRSLAGALCGNVGVIKCSMAEMCDDTNLADVVAFLPIVWPVGSTIGPLIGGALSHPFERFPRVFGSNQFWEEYPYFLPCATAAGVALSSATLGFFALRETLPSKAKPSSKPASRSPSPKSYTDSPSSPISPTSPTSPLSPSSSTQTLSDDLTSSIPDPEPAPSPPPLRSLLTPRLTLSIANYGLLALIEIAFMTLYPLFLSTPPSLGGLGFTSAQIGSCLAGMGLVNGLFQFLLFGKIQRRWGSVRVYRVGLGSFLVLILLCPIMNEVVRANGGQMGVLGWSLLGAQLAGCILVSMTWGCIFILIMSSAPSSSALGATNGLAQTTASIARAIGPESATSLFAISVEKDLLGGRLVYVVLLVLVGLGLVASLGLKEEGAAAAVEGGEEDDHNEEA
ncbi:MFS general substrate transporter [Sistotremastrum suecicum HHB10207 ss-3]|uniref:MFS general substrate transporter n=1 Tax=Sistotremastrum suecicum HHB10207 ss-3 TaxID=1314776 RepID=A0A166DR58_9AGAM|nr:MFS general substrate transporter [Sistotremastrum suecicum HHB10207 ss-3]